MPKVYTAGTRAFHTCMQCNNDILPGQEYRWVGKKKYHLRPNCEHAKSAPVTKPPATPDKSEVKFHNGNRTRLLRCYSGKAHLDHDCYACSHSPYVNQQMISIIFEGWQYNAEVWLICGHLEVRFFHESCPFDPDEEDMRFKEEDEWDAEEEYLPLAA